MPFRGLWAHDWRFLLQVPKGTLISRLRPQITQSNLCGFLQLLQSKQIPGGLAWASCDCEVTHALSAQLLAGFQEPRPADLAKTTGTNLFGCHWC